MKEQRRQKTGFARYRDIFLQCLRIAFSDATAYRANFVLSLLIIFFGNVLFPLVTILIYGSGAGFPGWNFYEVLLIQAIFTISTGISNIFFNGIFWQTNIHIREGTFEITLIKPLDTLFFLGVTTIRLDNIGLVLGGGIMTGIALAHIEGITGIMVLQSIVLFLGGVCVMLGITLIMAATAFKWVGNSRIPEIFDSILLFAKYPQSIFPGAVRGFTAFIMPVAMIGFFPASALLGKSQPAHFIALVPCVLFMCAGIALYKCMIHLYEGVGG